MNWLFPGFLAGAFALGLPLLLHLLRRWPRQPVVFPSLRFLAPSSRRIENWWQRLCRWLVLALRCAIFALLAAVFARPFQGGDLTRPSRAVVIVVDNSFSLQAEGRWEELRTWARDKAGTFARGDKFGLMLMAPQPTWLVAPTTETARPLRTLATLSPGWLTARVEPALRMAGDALAAMHADRREIIVLGDQQRVSWSGADFTKKLPPGVAVTFPPLPAAVERQAAVLPPTLARTANGIRCSVTVHNFTGPQTRMLRVYRDGSVLPVREEKLELGRHELRTVELNVPGPSEQAAWFRFSLDKDDLPADDSAYAVWQPTGDGSLLLDRSPAAAGADFTAIALTAAAELKPALKIEPLPTGAWPVRAVAVLRNDASFAGAVASQLDAFLAAGGSALVFATGGPDEQSWLAAQGLVLSPLTEQSESWQVHDWSLDHPLVAALSQRRLEVLLGWEFKSGWALPVSAVTAVAHWSDAIAAIGEIRVGAGKVLVCGFSPDRRAGDWPVMPSFVPFLHQAAAYLLRAQQAAIVAGQTGQTLSLAGAAGQWFAVDGPAVGNAAVGVSGSVMPMAPGVYALAQGKDRKFFAVNLPSEESDLATWDAGTPWLGLVSAQPAPEGKVPRAQVAAVDAEQRAPLWWWAAAAIAALMLAELGLANRTAR